MPQRSEVLPLTTIRFATKQRTEQFHFVFLPVVAMVTMTGVLFDALTIVGTAVGAAAAAGQVTQPNVNLLQDTSHTHTP